MRVIQQKPMKSNDHPAMLENLHAGSYKAVK